MNLLIFIWMLIMTAQPGSIYDFKVTSIEGKPVTLSDYKGKVVLFVNVASKCGYTSQYRDLQALYEKYDSSGLVIIGIPANNFGGQEPGTDKQIMEFCSTTYQVTFPMLSKMSAKGKDQSGLFSFLTSQENADFTGEIRWNFEKFLVNREGKLVHRYRSGEKPLGGDLEKAIQSLL